MNKNNVEMAVRVLILSFVVVAACSCELNLKPSFPFPEREIVFQANDDKNYALGFMNSDGSQPVIIQTYDERISQPVWSKKNRTIYFHRITGYTGMEYPGSGPMGRMLDGQWPPKICQNNLAAWAIYPFFEPDKVLYSLGARIGIFNIKECKVERILIDYSKENQPNYLNSPFPSHDGKFIVYENYFSGNYIIRMYDIKTGQESPVGMGINPTISPDDKKIAFMRPDGIYIKNIDLTGERKLLEYRPRISDYEMVTPIPQWSPDGEWLVYHKCMLTTLCSGGSEFSIFKVRISDGVEMKLYDGGVYPYWP